MFYKTMSVQKANILVAYDYILKNPDVYIIQKIVKDFYKKFDPFLKLDQVANISAKTLLPMIIHRDKENLFEWLSKKEFDYNGNYEFLHNKFKDMYNSSTELRMYSVLQGFSASYCIDTIYIYNEVYDKRQHYDITTGIMFKNPVQYVTGNLKEVIDAIGDLNIVYDHSAKRVAEINENYEYEEIVFGVGNYGYNFNPDNPIELKYDLYKRKNVAYFPVYTEEKDNDVLG